MNRTLVFATVLASSLASTSLLAQAAHTTAPAAPAQTPRNAVLPQATPAKIAIIAFENAVVATNEGQRAVAEIQKKYEPKKAQIDALSKEVESLKAQNQALPANTPDEERARRIRDIDTKDKELQRDVEDAQNSYQADVQDAYGKVAQKVGATAVKYAQENGFTLLFNVGGQQGANPLLWFDPAKGMDITQAVINAYNASSGVAPPPPSAPTPTRRSTPAHPAAPSH